MSHIHIALVGQQPVPVFLGIKSQKPDKVICIVSDRTEDVARRVCAVSGIKDCSFVAFPPVELAEIRQRIEHLAQSIGEDDTVSVNLVGGTKHWALAFFDYFSRRSNARIILSDQNNNITDYYGGDIAQQSIDMQTTFRLFGHTPKGYQNIGNYDDSDYMVASDACLTWLEYQKDFTNVTTGAGSNSKELSNLINNKSGSYTFGGNTISWRGSDDVKLCFKDGYEILFKSPNALKLVTMTGWFEYLVGVRIAQWRQTKETRLNCRMTEINDKEILNEFDVVAYTGTKLLFVECKTNIYKPTDIDKFAKGIRTYGGTASKGIFVTYYPISNSVRKKLQMHKIPYYQYKEDNQEELFKLLDRIHNEINEG